MKSTIMITGVAGLIAAIVTGAGEFVLHFDALARFGADNQFFLGISDQRTSVGHFLGVLGAPLYLIGAWHIHLMLKPANPRLSFAIFLTTAYGFAVGAVWIGSRASISALINTPLSPDVEHLMALYDFRYETLLQIIRVTTLLLSVVFIWLTLTGRSHYPRWMAWLNPIVLLVSNFVIYYFAPSIGKYLMPIALNVAFFLFFSASLFVASKKDFQQ